MVFRDPIIPFQPFTPFTHRVDFYKCRIIHFVVYIIPKDHLGKDDGLFKKHGGVWDKTRSCFFKMRSSFRRRKKMEQ